MSKSRARLLVDIVNTGQLFLQRAERIVFESRLVGTSRRDPTQGLNKFVSDLKVLYMLVSKYNFLAKA